MKIDFATVNTLTIQRFKYILAFLKGSFYQAWMVLEEGGWEDLYFSQNLSS